MVAQAGGAGRRGRGARDLPPGLQSSTVPLGDVECAVICRVRFSVRCALGARARLRFSVRPSAQSALFREVVCQNALFREATPRLPR